MPADDIIVSLAHATVGLLGLAPDQEPEPWGDPVQTTIDSERTAWTVFWTVWSYTRGVGFSQDPDGTWHVAEPLQAVIVSATARYGGFAANPGNLSLEAWTASEKKILHAYRRIAG